MVASDEDTTPTYALDALAANLSIDVTPVGNIGGDAEQEFGLTSSTGANASNTPYKDKMILYAAVVVQEGTSDYVDRRSPLHGGRVMGAEGQPVEPRRAGLREQRGAAGDLRGLLFGARG